MGARDAQARPPGLDTAVPAEGRKSIAQACEARERLDDGLLQRTADLVFAVVMPIDIAADP